MYKMIITNPLEAQNTINYRSHHPTIIQKELPVLLYDLWLLKNEFTFFVLLGLIISPLIFPPQHLTAIAAVDVSDRVQPRHEVPVLLGPNSYVHCMREQKSSPISSLRQPSNQEPIHLLKKSRIKHTQKLKKLYMKGFRNDIIMEADMIPAIAAAVEPRTH